MAIETLEVARQDGRGRRLAGGAEREALIAAFAQSGMTQQAFAEREGINRFTLATWRIRPVDVLVGGGAERW